jgi:hypothetical protein
VGLTPPLRGPGPASGVPIPESDEEDEDEELYEEEEEEELLLLDTGEIIVPNMVLSDDDEMLEEEMDEIVEEDEDEDEELGEEEMNEIPDNIDMDEIRRVRMEAYALLERLDCKDNSDISVEEENVEEEEDEELELISNDEAFPEEDKDDDDSQKTVYPPPPPGVGEYYMEWPSTEQAPEAPLPEEEEGNNESSTDVSEDVDEEEGDEIPDDMDEIRRVRMEGYALLERLDCKDNSDISVEEGDVEEEEPTEVATEADEDVDEEEVAVEPDSDIPGGSREETESDEEHSLEDEKEEKEIFDYIPELQIDAPEADCMDKCKRLQAYMREKGCGGIVQCRKRPRPKATENGNNGNKNGSKCYTKAVAKCS